MDRSDNSEIPFCSICQQSAPPPGCDWRFTHLGSCGHMFHEHCIFRWLHFNKDFCPNCNAKIKEEAHDDPGSHAPFRWVVHSVASSCEPSRDGHKISATGWYLVDLRVTPPPGAELRRVVYTFHPAFNVPRMVFDRPPFSLHVKLLSVGVYLLIEAHYTAGPGGPLRAFTIAHKLTKDCGTLRYYDGRYNGAEEPPLASPSPPGSSSPEEDAAYLSRNFDPRAFFRPLLDAFHRPPDYYARAPLDGHDASRDPAGDDPEAGPEAGGDESVPDTAHRDIDPTPSSALPPDTSDGPNAPGAPLTAFASPPLPPMRSPAFPLWIDPRPATSTPPFRPPSSSPVPTDESGADAPRDAPQADTQTDTRADTPLQLPSARSPLPPLPLPPPTARSALLGHKRPRTAASPRRVRPRGRRALGSPSLFRPVRPAPSALGARAALHFTALLAPLPTRLPLDAPRPAGGDPAAPNPAAHRLQPDADADAGRVTPPNGLSLVLHRRRPVFVASDLAQGGLAAESPPTHYRWARLHRRHGLRRSHPPARATVGVQRTGPLGPLSLVMRVRSALAPSQWRAISRRALLRIQ